MKNFVDRLKQFTRLGIEISLGVFVVAMLGSALQARANPAALPGEITVSSAVVPISGTSCLRDNVTGSVMSWDNVTGAYTFCTCTGFTLSGTGTIQVQSSIVKVSDRQSDRNVSAGFNTGQRTGTAVIYVLQGPGVWRVYRIYDTTSFGNVCSCS